MPDHEQRTDWIIALARLNRSSDRTYHIIMLCSSGPNAMQGCGVECLTCEQPRKSVRALNLCATYIFLWCKARCPLLLIAINVSILACQKLTLCLPEYPQLARLIYLCCFTIVDCIKFTRFVTSKSNMSSLFYYSEI